MQVIILEGGKPTADQSPRLKAANATAMASATTGMRGE